MLNRNSHQKSFAIRLDPQSGVPVYRQIIDQITGALANEVLRPGNQLPTVRQLAVDLAVNPNTVIRAYRELEIRGILNTQQGSGTFIGAQQKHVDQGDRERMLARLVAEFVSRAGQDGFTVKDLHAQLRSQYAKKKGRTNEA